MDDRKKQAVKLDDTLKGIEFPGEKREEIFSFLEKIDFTCRVMSGIKTIEQRKKLKNTLFWIFFLIFNLALLSLSGANHELLRELFSFIEIFSIIFSIIVGLIILGATVGLILSLDTTWLARFTYRNTPDELPENSQEARPFSVHKPGRR